jgi:uncharacterized Zn-finger protein
MNKYYCYDCDYEAKIKGNYDRHLKTKKHREKVKSHPKTTPKSPLSHPKTTPKSPFLDEENNNGYPCKYCNQSFKYKQGMYRHIKYTCKKNKDEDFKELARLLNEKDKQIKELISDKDAQFHKMQKQIDKLINKLQIQNMNGGNINNGSIVNNTMNIQLLNHGDTDYSHLTPKDYITCIKDCNHCVKSLIEKVHFNTEKPENMNIYLSNIKGKYVMIFKDNEWQIKDKKTQVDDLYDYNEFVLEHWYDEYAEKYPNIIESFKTYLKNRDSNTLLNEIKEEILVLLYNKRKMIAIEG